MMSKQVVFIQGISTLEKMKLMSYTTNLVQCSYDTITDIINFFRCQQCTKCTLYMVWYQADAV